MRDHYAIREEAEMFGTWLRTGRADTNPASDFWAPWVETISGAVARGVVVRRARVVSEPVSDCIRHMHANAAVNIHAGEKVRWLPRPQASDLALPGNDYWLFDDRVIRWNHFSGDGAWVAVEDSSEPSAAALCRSAFDAVWERATPHDRFTP
nr:DUF6879 family protein [Streptomyces boncukensis]